MGTYIAAMGCMIYAVIYYIMHGFFMVRIVVADCFG